MVDSSRNGVDRNQMYEQKISRRFVSSKSVAERFWENFRSEWDIRISDIEDYKRALAHGLLHMYDDYEFSNIDQLKEYLIQQSNHDVVQALAHVWARVRHLPGIEHEVKKVWKLGAPGNFAPELWSPILSQVRFPPLKTSSRLPRALRDSCFEVYRGGETEDVKDGLSWTLSRTVAVKFATMVKYNLSRGGYSYFVPQNPIVLMATATLSDVLWYESGRREKECVMSPEWVRRKSSAEVYSFKRL